VLDSLIIINITFIIHEAFDLFDVDDNSQPMLALLVEEPLMFRVLLRLEFVLVVGDLMMQ
jgi:hypothetical protein